MKQLKQLFGFILVASLCILFAQGAEQGQKTVQSTWVYWDPGSGETDSTLKIVVNDDSIYADSSGTWKTMSGTADSCSYPFYITDNSGAVKPIWLQVISPLIQTDRLDSNALTFRLETRELLSIKSGGSQTKTWDRWIASTKEITDGNITVLSTVTTIAADTVGTKERQKLRFSASGTQARLCPTIPASASAGAADTTYFDSLYYIGR